MLSRQNRMDEMIRAWWTIEELVTVPSSTKLINKNPYIKPKWLSTPELREEYNKNHCVEWIVARGRYYRWYSTYDACNRPKWWRPLSYKK